MTLKMKVKNEEVTICSEFIYTTFSEQLKQGRKGKNFNIP